MALDDKPSGFQSFYKIIFVTGCLLLFVVAGRSNVSVAYQGIHLKHDTLSPIEVSRLKRADIYVIIVQTDSVCIKLKNRDSIMMSRTSFEALPGDVRKEISAQNDGLFSNVQIESSYPGGRSGWMTYLMRTFRYPQDAFKYGVQGTVVVQFIVNEQEKVSDIEAISGPTLGGLREEAIHVIKHSGKWEPAIWNGYKVTSYKRQSIIFSLGQ